MEYQSVGFNLIEIFIQYSIAPTLHYPLCALKGYPIQI